VYDIEILDVGSSAFTEIPSEKILALMDRPDAGKMKCWVHRHPLGTDKPGPHNWSGTDNRTAEQEPLGGIPELVKWSISIVRTPQAWVGRFDRYQDGQVITFHLPVEYGVEQAFIEKVRGLRKAYEARVRKEALAFQPFPLSLPQPETRGASLLNFLVKMNASLTSVVGRIGKRIG
jgi:hypothetical protein